MTKRKNDTDDYGYKKTDEQLEELEARLSSLYTETSKNVQKELEDFLKQYKDDDAEKQKELKAGTITEKEYKAWKRDSILNTKKMQAQVDALTEDLTNTDKLAMQMINGQLPSVYASNYNFEGYKTETIAQANGIDYSSFTVYNAEAVSRIVKEKPDLLPSPSVDIPKDQKWNKDHINLAIAQGIVQGDPVDKIAERLQIVTKMDENAAIRNARTALIGAQNAGRKDAADRVRASGIEMIDVWSCTYDDRTRDTHIALDGQERGKDGYFHTFTGEKLEYPCDPNGAPAEVYNCRCRLNSFIKGIDHSKDKELYEDFMEKGGYEGWEKTKEKAEEKREGFEKNKEKMLERMKETMDIRVTPETFKEEPKVEEPETNARKIAEGKDIIEKWQTDGSALNTSDILEAQGFNGLPKVVDKKEFKQACKDSNFIAQRIYSAKSQDLLDQYRDQFYNGDFYIDTQKAAFGHGMYCASAEGEKITKGIKEDMEYYRSDSASFAYIETMTLDPSAKVGDYNELWGELVEKADYYYEKDKTSPESQFWNSLDLGQYAALKGYDAVHVSKEDTETSADYTVVLNRTKLVILEPDEKKKKGG